MEQTTLQNALASAPIGILLIDNKGNIQWHNNRLEELLDVRRDQLAGQSSKSLSGELRGVLIEPPDTLFLQRGETHRWLRCDCQTNADGSRIHYYSDISTQQRLQFERDQLAEDLQQLTTRDPITGLPNRRALLQGLEPLISRSRRYGNPLSIIKLNVRLSGGSDSALESSLEKAWGSVGQLLKDQMRWADIIGRYDGSDFMLILPETPEDAARQLADKLCSLIAEIKLSDSEGHNLQVKPYCGIAGWSKGDDATLMLKRVSDNVTAAQQAGTPIAAVN